MLRIGLVVSHVQYKLLKKPFIEKKAWKVETVTKGIWDVKK